MTARASCSVASLIILHCADAVRSAPFGIGQVSHSVSSNPFCISASVFIYLRLLEWLFRPPLACPPPLELNRFLGRLPFPPPPNVCKSVIRNGWSVTIGIDEFMSLFMSLTKPCSSRAQKDSAIPLAPALPVRPIL